jgi:hypothetical protein
MPLCKNVIATVGTSLFFHSGDFLLAIDSYEKQRDRVIEVRRSVVLSIRNNYLHRWPLHSFVYSMILVYISPRNGSFRE